jgi:hypothetical protein
MIHHPRWIIKKYLTYCQIVLIVKLFNKVKWYLTRVSNLIQIINNYDVENKYDLTEQTNFMLKSSNQNILGEEIIITLKIDHRKVKLNHLWFS